MRTRLLARSSCALVAAFVLLGSPRRARADVFEIGPADDLVAAIAMLAPGDELVLAGGTYSVAQRLTIDVSGTEAMPIVIRAKDGETPIITRPDDAQNTVNIEGASYVVLRGLEIMGGSAGIAIGDSSFITIEDCEVHDTGDVAIAANRGGMMQGMRFRHNHIHDTGGTGEAMYLGCHDGSCQFFEGIIENNWIHNTDGPTVEQGDGIEIKQGSHDNVVRDNVIHDTNYPCLISYNVNGNGGPNVFERNLLWGCGDHGIQSEADVIIRNNVILSAAADGIRHNNHVGTDPTNIVVVNNTVLKADGIAYRADGVAGALLLANNAFYALNGDAIRIGGNMAGVTVVGNAGVGGVQGPNGGFVDTGNLASDFVAANPGGGVPNDVFPRPGSILVGTGDAGNLAADDFNGTARAGAADIGAYKFDANGNPGWTLQDNFKDAVSTGEGGGAGTGASTGATSTANGSGANASGAGSGAGTGAGSGAGGGGGADGGGEDDGGCGCRVGADGANGKALLAIAGVALGVVRLRRRARGRGRGEQA